jgi:hypothetical protein
MVLAGHPFYYMWFGSGTPQCAAPSAELPNSYENDALATCLPHFRWKQALRLLEVMWQCRGELVPDIVSYNTVMKACGNAQQTDTAFEVRWVVLHGTVLTCQHRGWFNDSTLS